MIQSGTSCSFPFFSFLFPLFSFQTCHTRLREAQLRRLAADAKRAEAMVRREVGRAIADARTCPGGWKAAGWRFQM